MKMVNLPCPMSYDSNLGSKRLILAGDIRSRIWPNIGDKYRWIGKITFYVLDWVSYIHKKLRSSLCRLTCFFWLLSHVIYFKLTRVLEKCLFSQSWIDHVTQQPKETCQTTCREKNTCGNDIYFWITNNYLSIKLIITKKNLIYLISPIMATSHNLGITYYLIGVVTFTKKVGNEKNTCGNDIYFF